jgi:hypothetical protein
MNKPTIQQRFSLSFTGGPLDGYAEETDTPLHEMPEVLGILVSPAIVKMLSTQRAERQMASTSLAFYQQITPTERRYAFVGSTLPDVLEFEDLKTHSSK